MQHKCVLFTVSKLKHFDWKKLFWLVSDQPTQTYEFSSWYIYIIDWSLLGNSHLILIGGVGAEGYLWSKPFLHSREANFFFKNQQIMQNVFINCLSETNFFLQNIWCKLLFTNSSAPPPSINMKWPLNYSGGHITSDGHIFSYGSWHVSNSDHGVHIQTVSVTEEQIVWIIINVGRC